VTTTMSRLFLLSLLILALVLTACFQPKAFSPAPSTTPPPAQPQDKPNTSAFTEVPAAAAHPVPSEYQAMYADLMQKLTDFDSNLDKRKTSSTSRVTIAAELLTANSNIGENLFTDTNFQANRVYLDALQAINITGVQVSIMYPLLTTDFPNQQKYLAFYKKLMQELRLRKLTVLVKVGNPFANSVYSDLTISFDGLTLEKYRSEKKAMVQLIARELKPDYLTVCNEPNTEKMTMGILQTPAQYAATTQYILEGLDRFGILIGGGAGTWDDLAYMKALADTGLDYLDAHIYPLEFLPRFIDISDIAHANNKRLVVGEAWVYKLSSNDYGRLGDVAATSRIYGRDVFSFWEPLDSKFLTVLIRMAGIYGYEFVSPFWTNYLYGYIDYSDATKGLAYRQLRQESNLVSYLNMLQGKPSGSGLTYKKLGQQYQ